MNKDTRKILNYDNGNILIPAARAVSWVAGFFEGEGNFG